MCYDVGEVTAGIYGYRGAINPGTESPPYFGQKVRVIVCLPSIEIDACELAGEKPESQNGTLEIDRRNVWTQL